MKIRLHELKQIIRKILREVACKRCKADNTYAEPNQSDGSYLCYTCRSNEPWLDKPGTASQAVPVKQHTNIRFEEGATSSAAFAEEHLGPYFEDGTIKPYPGAAYYAIAYGELGAYSGRGPGDLLAIWSAEVPDDSTSVRPNPSYVGKWERP